MSNGWTDRVRAPLAKRFNKGARAQSHTVESTSLGGEMRFSYFFSSGDTHFHFPQDRKLFCVAKCNEIVKVRVKPTVFYAATYVSGGLGNNIINVDRLFS